MTIKSYSTSDTEDSEFMSDESEMEALSEHRSMIHDFYASLSSQFPDFLFVIINALENIEHHLDSVLENVHPAVKEECWDIIDLIKCIIEELKVQEENMKKFSDEEPVPRSVLLYEYMCEQVISAYKKKLHHLLRAFTNLWSILQPLVGSLDQESTNDWTTSSERSEFP